MDKIHCCHTQAQIDHINSAELMSSFATGERYINRVWSDSTDGYVDEVMMHVEKSLYQFKHAKEEFEEALNKV